MTIRSLFKDDLGWQELEVEVQLLRGLPRLQIVGRADHSIKESALRLKSAFEQLGWPWPRARQVVVNLRPSYLKKMSAGLDLPIALALAKALGVQSPLFESDEAIYAFGELSLSGDLTTSEDLSLWPAHLVRGPVITGDCASALPFDRFELKHLSRLSAPELKPRAPLEQFLERPPLSPLGWPKSAAQLIEVLAAGQHHGLIAGPAGSGKTTLISGYSALLPTPKEKSFHWGRALHLERGETLKWRPLVQPHHSITPASMTGGGVPLKAGALSLAHGGLLVMDEYLEFDPRIQEALREPLERKSISLHRGNRSQTMPTNFQLLATTNLCPCGKLVPGRSQTSCRYSLSRCRSTLERLSGPMLDRFDILALSHQWQQRGPRIESEAIFSRVSKAHEFQEQLQRSTPNKDLELNELEGFVTPHLLSLLPGSEISLRRRRAILRVSRTLADLDLSEVILKRHLVQAMELALRPFLEIEQLG